MGAAAVVSAGGVVGVVVVELDGTVTAATASVAGVEAGAASEETELLRVLALVLVARAGAVVVPGAEDGSERCVCTPETEDDREALSGSIMKELKRDVRNAPPYKPTDCELAAAAEAAEASASDDDDDTGSAAAAALIGIEAETAAAPVSVPEPDKRGDSTEDEAAAVAGATPEPDSRGERTDAAAG